MTSTASELTWIKQLLADMSIEMQNSMNMFCDNQAARLIALNLVFHERTKHIEVDCHFIRFNQKNETPYMKSGEQLADTFIKGLDPSPFEDNSSKLGMSDIYTPNLRGVLKIISIRDIIRD
jgi:hypothetical protein